MRVATVLKKPHALIKLAQTACLLQHQFINFLIAASQSTHHYKKEYTIPLSILLNYLNNTRDTQRIRDITNSLQELKTAVVFNSRRHAKFPFFSSIIIKKSKKSLGSLVYTFSPEFQSIILDTKQTAPINLFIERALKCRYSLAIYELCMIYKSKHQTPWLDCQDLRDYLNVTDSHYTGFKFFNNRILKKVVKEINEKMDITIQPFYQKDAKGTITALKFSIKKQGFDRFFLDFFAPKKSFIQKLNQLNPKKRKTAPIQSSYPKKEITLVLRALGISACNLAKRCPLYTISAQDFDCILELFKTNKKNILFVYKWLQGRITPIISFDHYPEPSCSCLKCSCPCRK